MPNPIVIVNYQLCQPKQCGGGICAAAAECPNKVLQQESPGEFPFSRPSRFCRGCAKCAQACKRQAIKVSGS